MTPEQIAEIFNSVLATFSKENELTPSGLPSTIPVIKQYDDEKMIAIEPLYCGPMQVDAHGAAMSLEEINKMVDSFNKNISKISGNIGHMVNTEKFKPVKAWVNPCDCIIGETFVPEGQPIVQNQFYDKDLWEYRKAGKLLGVSIGAKGQEIPYEDPNN